MESNCGSIIKILMQLHLECVHIVIFLKEKSYDPHTKQYTHCSEEPIGEMKNGLVFLAPQLIVHCISRGFFTSFVQTQPSNNLLLHSGLIHKITCTTFIQIACNCGYSSLSLNEYTSTTTVAIQVVEFSSRGYRIRKIFA